MLIDFNTPLIKKYNFNITNRILYMQKLHGIDHYARSKKGTVYIINGKNIFVKELYSYIYIKLYNIMMFCMLKRYKIYKNK